MSDFEKFRKDFQKALETNFGKENVLPFWGNQNAKIVHIGQAPSSSGVKNKKPFTDKTGEKLRSWYGTSEEVFYNPENFYFTAIGMYFPGKSKNGGDKLPSLPFAKEWLTNEISFLHPKLFILLGRTAANFFFPKKIFKELVFEDQAINGVKTFVIPHASPLNIKWFKDNPEFLKKRLPEIKNYIRTILNA